MGCDPIHPPGSTSEPPSTSSNPMTPNIESAFKGSNAEVHLGNAGLNVFDAKHISEGPVWQGILPNPLPLGLHGTFAKS